MPPVLVLLIALIVAVGAFMLGWAIANGPDPSDPVTPDTIETPIEPDTPATPETPGTPETPVTPDSPESPDTPESPDPPATPDGPGAGIERDGYYYDVESVVLYLDTFGELPPNFITKKEAERHGWEGGVPDEIFDGAAIGGDRYGNYERLLPRANYYEADIDTYGRRSRGSRRLIYTFDRGGAYYYTDDHYESFTRLYVEDGEVIWDD
ncbi:MAG: hypothetical protein IJH87_02615 [Atopobiaceae bacterium]|nr:hypothetical protein [Atopobiaceae bacterium]